MKPLCTPCVIEGGQNGCKPFLVRGTTTHASQARLAFHTNPQVVVKNVVTSRARKSSCFDSVKHYFMSDQPYTEPEIVRAKTKWYVKLYYQNPFNKDRWDRFHVLR